MPKNLKSHPLIKQIFPAEKVDLALSGLTEFIINQIKDSPEEPVLVGIHTRGVALTKRLAEIISKKLDIKIPVGELDITLYRDDFSTSGVQPVVGETHLDFEIDHKKIILIDDVLFTGRTIRAALDEIMDYGRPSRIVLAVAIDRGHRELPIEPNFAAIKLDTKPTESVVLHLKETDGQDQILICQSEEKA